MVSHALQYPIHNRRPEHTHTHTVKFVATFVDDAHGEGVMASDAAMVGHVAKACDVRGADVGCECMSMMVCMAR